VQFNEDIRLPKPCHLVGIQEIEFGSFAITYDHHAF